MPTAPPLATVVGSWPRPYQIAWLGTTAVVGVFVYALASYWLDGVDTSDRLLIVLAAGWAWNRMRGGVAAIPTAPLPTLGLPLVALGCLVVAPPWFAFAQIGAKPVLLWILYASALAAVGGLTLAQFGWRTLNAVRFPLFFVALALPIPSRINVPIQGLLQDWTTTFAHQGFLAWGFSSIREGFVLRLPHGDLGVVEACSGIRSVTALTAIAVFLAHLRGFGLVRGILTVLLAVPIIVFVNGCRVFLTGMLQEYVGREAILGWKHEALGFALVFIGLGLIVLLTKLLAGREAPAGEPETPAPTVPDSPPVAPSLAAGWALAAVAVVGVGAGAYAFSRPTVARSALPDGKAPIDQIPMTLGEWTARDLPIDEEIPQILRYNACTFRAYRNKLGYESYVWVIYWSTAKAVKDYHHPDVCMPNRGSDPLTQAQLTLTTPGGRTLPLAFREFQQRNTGNKQILVYWTQEGRSIWTPADEAIAKDQFSYPFKWIVKRTGERPADSFDDRIVVLIGTPSWGAGDGPKAALLDFSGRLADELYRVCPWADPGAAKPD
jgi:exosortase